MRKVISLLLTVLLLLSVMTGLPMTAAAQTYQNFEYEDLPDGTAEITGFTSETAADVNIYIEGKDVSSIGDHAFHNITFGYFYSFVSVNMLPTVKRIGESAFHDCTSLQELTLSDTLETIGERAFFNCSGLTALSLPQTVKSIADNAFSGCTGLKSITVDENNPYYASVDGILLNKDKTELVKLPDGKNNTVTIPDGVTKIGSSAIYKSQASVIVLPASLKALADDAISYNSKLTELRYLGTQADWEKVTVGSGNALEKLTFHTHTWDNGTITENATCGKDGVRTYTCTGCGATKTEAIPATGAHTWNDGAVTTEVTCGKDGVRTYTCTDCGATKTEAIPATGAHTWKGGITDKATVGKNGVYTRTCTVCGAQTTVSVAMIKQVTLSATGYTYDGKRKTPAVTVKDSTGRVLPNACYTVSYSSKNYAIGTSTVTVNFRGNYGGSKVLKFNIVPKGTTISKLTAGKKAFTVKWKKQASQTNGYQIQYTTDAKFKTGVKTVNIFNTKTLSRTIKGLQKNKVYYVRIKTFKKVGGTYYFSNASGIKKIKTK